MIKIDKTNKKIVKIKNKKINKQIEVDKYNRTKTNKMKWRIVEQIDYVIRNNSNR
jgi:hypothetical protein